MADKKTDIRNIILHIIEGGFFMGGMVFLDQYTIMIGYMRQITRNPLLISLIPASLVIGFNVSGLLTVHIVQKIHNKHLFIVITGFFQRLMILFLVFFTISLGHFTPLVSGLISALIYFLFSGIGGISVPAWLDLLSRTVPSGRRSRVVAIRNAIGAGTGIVFPVLIAYILRTFAFPGNYRILFIIAFVFLMISWMAFIFINDHDAPAVNETSNSRFSAFIKSLPAEDPNFLRFLISRVIFSFCIITMTFHTVYFFSKNEGIDDTIVASFALALNISKIAGGLFLGYIGDRKGNVSVYKIGILMIIPTNLLMIYSPSIPAVYIVFILFGMTIAADLNTTQSFLGEFGNRNNRIFYTTMGSSVAGIFTGFLPIAAGALLKFRIIEFNTLFIFCAVLALICYIYVSKSLRDPSRIS
ncbi:MAG: MFS transporter [Spirochaetes bacterium]|nr:MFS transporter [Spirochaetota bacterium]